MDEYCASKIESSLEIFDQMPQGIWWKDRDLRYRLINQKTARSLGYKSSAISYEQIMESDLPCKASELSDDFNQQDELVMRTKKQLSAISYCGYSRGDWKILMGHKSPRFNSQKEVIGMMGSSVDITSCSVMRTALLLLSNDDKLIGRKLNNFDQFTYMLKDTYDDFGLTQRQSECLFLLIRGKTAKDVARTLGISYRTVEKHFDVIKFKMNCYSKAELIEKALYNGAGTIIPKSIIGPRRNDFVEYDRFGLEILNCNDDAELSKLSLVEAENQFSLVYVNGKGWFFSGKSEKCRVIRDYLCAIPELEELNDLLSRKIFDDISEQSKHQLIYIIVSNLKM